jgi:hypothetical protein
MSSDQQEDEVYEAVQLLTGDTYIFRNGYKEEADPKDIFRFDAAVNQGNQISFQFSRFDFNPATPVGKVRLNRAVIAFAWKPDPKSDVIRTLKETVIKMDAAKAGLILPGRG